MSIYSKGGTNFTEQVKILLQKTYGRSPLKNSVLERAIEYYNSSDDSQSKPDESARNIAISSKKKSSSTSRNIGKNKQDGKDSLLERNQRFRHLHAICVDVLALCEGDNMIESNRKSAQLLGTIQLLLPTEGKNVATANEMARSLYKGVLALRLLDQLCLQNLLSNDHINSTLNSSKFTRYSHIATDNKALYDHFVANVKIPILMAAILQDIGTFHPKAQEIILGNDGNTDNFRTLEADERKALLQINYRETISYLVNGIGVDTYTGNSKTERDEFNQIENDKLHFMKHLLKGSIQPKQGLGNLLKVPQIYTSIILSTKASYNYKVLPKVYQVLYQNAERGACRKDIVDLLYMITGIFPQGYGVTYIPNDIDVDGNIRYEYGIVTHLYPKNPEEPTCRIATRNLTFMGFGSDIIIKKEYNLYYVKTAKNFSMVSKERLNEILELLASNYQERKDLDLLPRCWSPTDYFSIKTNQKLWNRSRELLLK